MCVQACCSHVHGDVSAPHMLRAGISTPLGFPPCPQPLQLFFWPPGCIFTYLIMARK